MNLLPQAEKEILKKGFRARFLIVSNILLSVSFLVGVAMLVPSYFLARQYFSSVTSLDSFDKNENEESIKNILELPVEVDSKMDFLEANLKNRKILSSLATTISHLPNKVALHSFSIVRQNEKSKKGLTITISGIASDRESLVSFDSALKESGDFQTVDVPVSSLAKDRDLPFSMNIFIADEKLDS